MWNLSTLRIRIAIITHALMTLRNIMDLNQLEEKDYEKNEVKGSKSTAKYGNCPMNIQLTSIHMFDAQSMLQKLVSRLAILGVVTPLEDLNVKFLRSLPSEWDTHVVVWMNKPDFDTEGARVETYKQWGLMGRGRGAWGRVVGGIWLWEVGSDGGIIRTGTAHDSRYISYYYLWSHFLTSYHNRSFLPSLKAIGGEGGDVAYLDYCVNATKRRLYNGSIVSDSTCFAVTLAYSQLTLPQKTGKHRKLTASSSSSRQCKNMENCDIIAVLPSIDKRSVLVEGDRQVYTLGGRYQTVELEQHERARRYSNSQLNDKGFVNSRCSRHMTGNIAHLSDFKDFDGGYVTFGGGAYGGRITGKGTIKTDNLDFDDVYFVKELKFNLFSVSQMCDKKNYVLFTDSECLVLSPNFKLPDENQILLKIPRQDNMYSFDMKNIVPKDGLTCLVAKATSEESMLWHRRLVLKGKQHRASCIQGVSESSTSSQQDQDNQDCIVMPIWKDASYFDDASPRSVADAQIPRQMVNTATPEDFMGPIPTSEDTQVEDQEIELGNISPSYAVSSTPHTRIYKDHPIDHVIGDVQSSVQTRRKQLSTLTRISWSPIVKERLIRTFIHVCIACFLSQEEPKRSF
ncbi:hypothetical protein Tco_1351969 [Tanacetum coccineum]